LGYKVEVDVFSFVDKGMRVCWTLFGIWIVVLGKYRVLILPTTEVMM